MKIKKTRSIQQIIDDQMNKWKAVSTERAKEETIFPVITISRQFGSDGQLVAKRIAEDLNLDLFDQEIIQEIAENAHLRTTVVKTLDEKGVSGLEDMISAVTEKRHLWSYEYLHQLMRVIGTIGKHGRAVIIGRGAHFILPREDSFRVRIIAPLEMRIHAAAKEIGISIDEAKQLTIKTDSDRKAFIRKYFNAEIDDPQHYDLVINMESITVEAAAASIKAALALRKYI